METKRYIVENLDCANCAAKIEDKLNAHPRVASATITFATKTLQLEAENPDELIPELQTIARTVEGEVAIRPREGGCGCGHDHERHHEGNCGYLRRLDYVF